MYSGLCWADVNYRQVSWRRQQQLRYKRSSSTIIRPMSRLRQSHATLTRDKGSHVKVASVTGSKSHVASRWVAQSRDSLWSPYGIGQTIIFSCCFLLLFFFFSSPNLSRRRLDVCHVVFWTISTIKDEKSAAKFHNIKTVSGKVVAQWIAFRVVSIYWQGVAPFPCYLHANRMHRILKLNLNLNKPIMPYACLCNVVTKSQ